MINITYIFSIENCHVFMTNRTLWIFIYRNWLSHSILSNPDAFVFILICAYQCSLVFFINLVHITPVKLVKQWKEVQCVQWEDRYTHMWPAWTQALNVPGENEPNQWENAAFSQFKCFGTNQTSLKNCVL